MKKSNLFYLVFGLIWSISVQAQAVSKTMTLLIPSFPGPFLNSTNDNSVVFWEFNPDGSAVGVEIPKFGRPMLNVGKYEISGQTIIIKPEKNARLNEEFDTSLGNAFPHDITQKIEIQGNQNPFLTGSVNGSQIFKIEVGTMESSKDLEQKPTEMQIRSITVKNWIKEMELRR